MCVYERDVKTFSSPVRAVTVSLPRGGVVCDCHWGSLLGSSPSPGALPGALPGVLPGVLPRRHHVEVCYPTGQQPAGEGWSP